jgi:hypothetical protein
MDINNLKEHGASICMDEVTKVRIYILYVPGDKEYGYQEPQQRENPAQANKNYITEL